MTGRAVGCAEIKFLARLPAGNSGFENISLEVGVYTFKA